MKSILINKQKSPYSGKISDDNVKYRCHQSLYVGNQVLLNTLGFHDNGIFPLKVKISSTIYRQNTLKKQSLIKSMSVIRNQLYGVISQFMQLKMMFQKEYLIHKQLWIKSIQKRKIATLILFFQNCLL